MSSRRIFFVRHAKSSWADPHLDDEERPLNDRGNRDAPKMAKKLAAIIPTVDLLLCSPARRAQETSTYFKKEISFGQSITKEKIYHAWVDTLVEVITEISDDVYTAIIFGHNPGFTGVFNLYSKDTLDNLPTCGIFELVVEGSWSSASVQTVTTGHLLYPKMYKH